MKFCKQEIAGYVLVGGCLISGANIIRAGRNATESIKFSDTLAEDIRNNRIDQNCFVNGLSDLGSKKKTLNPNQNPTSLVQQAYNIIVDNSVENLSMIDKLKLDMNNATFLTLPSGGDILSKELVFASRAQDRLSEIAAKCQKVK